MCVNSVDFAMNRTVRAAATTISGGSISEFVWFATSSTGPSGATRAPPTVIR